MSKNSNTLQTIQEMVEAEVQSRMQADINAFISAIAGILTTGKGSRFAKYTKLAVVEKVKTNDETITTWGATWDLHSLIYKEEFQQQIKNAVYAEYYNQAMKDISLSLFSKDPGKKLYPVGDE